MIAVLLVIGGMITCSVAEDIALTDNYTLFHDNEEGGTYVREDFDAAEISKIELLITDAEITVYGGAEQAYIEFINFRDGLFTLSNSGKVISMDEIPDLKSIFNLQSGFSFSGMRYILRSGTVSLGEKKINIYLPQDAALKVLSVEADTCVLRTEKIYNQFDLQIHAEESVTMDATDFRTACALTVDTRALELKLFSSYLHTIDITAETVTVDAQEIYWDNLTLDIDEGTVNALSTIGLHRYAYNIKGKGGFTVNGEALTLPHTADGAGSYGGAISGDIGRAEITLNEIID